jgi:hypothetical protein
MARITIEDLPPEEVHALEPELLVPSQSTGLALSSRVIVNELQPWDMRIPAGGFSPVAGVRG